MMYEDGFNSAMMLSVRSWYSAPTYPRKNFCSACLRKS